MAVHTHLFQTSEPAYGVDRHGTVVAWNRAAECVFGYSKDEAQGQQCWKLLAGRDVFGNQSCCEGCPIRSTAFEHEQVNRFQVDFRTAGGRFERFTVSTLMLLDGAEHDVLVHLCRPCEPAPKTDSTPQIPPTSIRNLTLTKRETEVLANLHKGRSVDEIAQAMCISTSTVRNHIQHTLSKLHVHSRLEAVITGRRLGLI